MNIDMNMDLCALIVNAMQQIFPVKPTEDGARVVTQYIYPSNQYVPVIVRGGPHEYTVCDSGGAVLDVENAGAEINAPGRILGARVRRYGCTIENGIISSPPVVLDALPVAIALVAKVSQECSEFLYSHAKVPYARNIKKLVKEFLINTFDDRVKSDTAILGASNKPHHFDNVVELNSGKRLIIDPVINDGSSINSRVVAHYDVAHAHHEKLEQRIIYDDMEEWKPEDLNLLSVGASVVAYSRAPEVIKRLAA